MYILYTIVSAWTTSRSGRDGSRGINVLTHWVNWTTKFALMKHNKMESLQTLAIQHSLNDGKSSNIGNTAQFEWWSSCAQFEWWSSCVHTFHQTIHTYTMLLVWRTSIQLFPHMYMHYISLVQRKYYMCIMLAATLSSLNMTTANKRYHLSNKP